MGEDVKDDVDARAYWELDVERLKRDLYEAERGLDPNETTVKTTSCRRAIRYAQSRSRE